MPEVSKNKPSVWVQIQSLLNTINHILIGMMAVYITALGKSLNFQDTAMHAFMTVIGFHVLAAEALMVHYPLNPFTNFLSHRNKSRIHGILNFVGGFMILLGGFGKISQTEVHFTTWHGLVGLFATLMCGASMLGGIVAFFQPKVVHKLYPPAEIKYRHNLFGILTFTLGMASIFLGYRTQFFYKFVDAEFIPAISLTTVLVYILTLISPIKSLMDKRKYRNAAAKSKK